MEMILLRPFICICHMSYLPFSCWVNRLDRSFYGKKEFLDSGTNIIRHKADHGSEEALVRGNVRTLHSAIN